MASRLNLKLAIGILLVFGVLILGMLLYEPVWYRFQAARLCSDDKATREAAAKVVAEKGDPAIDYIRGWLKSEDDRLVGGACRVLEGMEGDIWEVALPELTEILHESPSARTDAAAGVVHGRDHLGKSAGRITWKYFSDDKRAKLNICLYLLSDSDTNLRVEAIQALGKLGDPRAVESLIVALRDGPNFRIRSYAAVALGRIGDVRGVEPLIKALANESITEARAYAAMALGEIDDPCVVEPLIKVLSEDPDTCVRSCSACGLALYNGTNVLAALEAAAEEKIPGAIIALAWQRGGEYLRAAGRVGIQFLWGSGFHSGAFARWGYVSSVWLVIHAQPNMSKWGVLRRFHADVFSRMPDTFPEFDFHAIDAVRKKQADAMKAWYDKHRHRLAWDETRRRYYLMPEKKD